MNKYFFSKYIVGAGAVMIGVAFVGLYVAKPNFLPRENIKSGRIVIIPENAVEVADHIFKLPSVVVDGKTVEGFMIVDYRKGFGHKPRHGPPGKNGSPKGGGKCFAFLAKGAKWNSVEPWVVNPANTEGLGDSFLLDNLGLDIQKWEDAAPANILGDGSVTSAILAADTERPDGNNEVYFGDIDSPGAIAVTVVWGRFSGPPSQRELIEWDQVYDDVDFNWSATGEPDKMDFANIAIHELGHSVGMGHPDDSCTEETMYRFADFGETKK